MRNKRFSYFGTITIIVGYLISSFGVCWHIAEENDAHSDCSACQETENNSDYQAFSEFCSNPSDCHNPTHKHHNHPIHDSHNCQICHTAFDHKITPSSTELLISSQDNSVKLFHVTEIIISQTTFTTESIRGPPSAS